MFEKDKHPIRNIIIGFGAYYLLSFLVCLYPATVMMTYFGSETEPGGLWNGFIAFAMTTIVIIVLIRAAVSYPGAPRVVCGFLLISLYLICLIPFIGVINQTTDPVYTDGVNENGYYNTEPIVVDFSMKSSDDIGDTAIEGGSNYWARFKFPDNYKDKYGEYSEIPFKDGQIEVYDIETDELLGYLNIATIKVGLQLMADSKDLKGKVVPARHFNNITTDNDDAETADVFMQLSVIGEIVYG